MTDDYAELREAIRGAVDIAIAVESGGDRYIVPIEPSVIAALLADRDRLDELGRLLLDENHRLREALREIVDLPTVVPDHPHGGIHPPYLEWTKVAEIARAALRGSGEEAGRG